MVRVFSSRKDITAVELVRKFIDEWHNRGFGVPILPLIHYLIKKLILTRRYLRTISTSIIAQQFIDVKVKL